MTYRIAAGIEYLGNAFHGWQRQSHSHSAQEALETALSQVADHDITVICAGRTDTGVHGIGQVVHFDTEAERSDYAWLMGTNTAAVDTISVRWVKQVPSDFHARYSAVARRYRYVILNRTAPSAVFHGRVTQYRRRLDADLMHKAAQGLLGEHDFSSFQSAGCQSNHARRELQALTVERKGDWVVLEIQANAFLYNMVRILVGTLVKVGAGDQPVDWPRSVLEAQSREAAGQTMPPNGLYFLGPIYPSHFAIPQPVDGVDGVW